MTASILTADTAFAAADAPAPSLGRMDDDRAMIRAAAELTRDLTAPSPAIYWADFLGSAALGYRADLQDLILLRLGEGASARPR